MELTELLAVLTLEQIDDNVFRAQHPVDRTRRLYGGQIMAQAALAAAQTVPVQGLASESLSRSQLHSLHGYFLRPGDPQVPAIIRVERTRDGSSFSHRRIVVLQHGQAIFNMDASFQVPETGRSHALPMPALTPPAEDKLPAYLYESPILTFRHEFRRLQSNHPQPPEQCVWFKANGQVPDQPLMHLALAIYESDNTLLGTTRLLHRGKFDREAMQVASLDHAMWFYGHIDLNEWHLYAQDSPSTSGGRGFTRGIIHAQDGRVVATTTQEGLIRVH